MIITPLYAGLLTLIFVLLSIRVIGGRRTAGVGLGDGGNRMLMRRTRVHGNFAEYAPLGLILMALAELQNNPGWIVHLLGLLLLSGRTFHAYGVSREPEVPRCRVLGMALTFGALITGAFVNLGLSGVKFVVGS